MVISTLHGSTRLRESI